MTDAPESALTFPCEFPIKVFGLADDQFLPTVLDIIRKHVPDLEETAIRSRPSKDNKYISLTILIYAESKEELDNIYRDLTSNPLILMAL